MFLPKLSFLSILLASSGAAAVSIDVPLGGHYPHDPHTLSGCLSQSRIETLLPTSANFSSAIQPYNLRTGLGWIPTALVLPHTPQEVAAAIRCANKFDIKVAARSGGHSYGAYGLGGQNGSLVIDLQNFNMLSVDPETQIATIGAGVRLGDIATHLYNNGKRALPHGMCGG
jgi:FAD/FMN-containing dehydrogenase